MVADAAALPPAEEIADDLPVDPSHLDALRRARRSRRVSQVHWVDALYRAYLAAVFGTLAVALVAGAVGDEPLTPSQVDDVLSRGPAAVGLVAALAVAVGLRSGSRGGPLALEAGDVRHVLLAPVDRARALRSPAARQVRTALFGALLLGAAIGRFADQRLPESGWVWVAAGAVAVVAVVALALGAALVAGGRRLPRPVATVLGGALVAWSALDLFRVEPGGTAVPASPGRAVGWVALAPLEWHPAAAGAVAVAVVLLALGLWGVGGLSVEAAERRTALVGQIRFAATLQDVRTVLVLRRQLAAERPRERPWFRLPGRSGSRPAWRRGWHGVLRFPASRVARLLLLAVVAGAALRGAWSGTAPLIVVAGLALWVAALDLVEPVAEEVDHPSRRDGYPEEEGALHVRLLAVPLVLAVALGLLAAAVASVPGAGQVPLAAALAAGVAAALTGCAGALASTVAGAPGDDGQLSLMAPEVAGMKTLLRAVAPPGLAVLGALPLLVVAADRAADRPAAGPAATLWLLVGGLVLLVVAWVHQRQAIRAWWVEAMETAQQNRNASTGRTDAEDQDDDDGGDGDEDEDDEEEGSARERD